MDSFSARVKFLRFSIGVSMGTGESDVERACAIGFQKTHLTFFFFSAPVRSSVSLFLLKIGGFFDPARSILGVGS